MISGKILAKDQFVLVESQQDINIDYAMSVLQGSLAAYLIHNFQSESVCEKIYTNFWSCSQKTPRIGYGEDGVEAYLIGASHIEKTTEVYLKEVIAAQAALQALFAGTSDPLKEFKNCLAQHNPQLNFRVAEHQNQKAGDSKAVYWNNTGEFLLEPHEDYAQTKDPLQQGFEIQKAKQIAALNFYAKVPKEAGQLKIWNIEPDDASRERLNLTYSGFPYPPAQLAGFDSLTIPVKTGDLLMINGNLLHGVLKGNEQASAKDRLLLTCFISAIDNEVIWWT